MISPAPFFAFLDVGGPEMLVVFVLALVLFGGKRMPELARNIGKSLRDFKKAREGVEDQIKRALDEDPVPARRVRKPRKPEPAPELATTTPEDTAIYDEAANAAGPAAAVAATSGGATDEPGPDETGTPAEAQPEGAANDEDVYVDPYEDEYIGGTAKSDASAHGIGDEGAKESPPVNGEPEDPDKKKSDSDPGTADGGGI